MTAATSWRPVVERAAQERGAQSTRLATHRYALSTMESGGRYADRYRLQAAGYS